MSRVALLAAVVAAWQATAGDERRLEERALARIESPPLGLPPLPLPGNERPTPAIIGLGRKLFLDRRLSRNGTLSCAMCHVPEQGFTSNEMQTAVGNEGRTLPRNSPSLFNVGYLAPFFHDGREPSLDLQPFDVFVNPDEMAAPSIGALVARVAALPDYADAFSRAYRDPPSVENIGGALAAFMRSLVSADSPFDRWRFGGEAEALSADAQRGFDLFVGEAGCAGCHLVEDEHALFTDHGFHDTGIGWRRAMVENTSVEPVRIELAPGVHTTVERSVVRNLGRPPPHDIGRYAVTLDPADRWRFKTPGLRNVALTAPYMHDGSLSTLREVVEFYDGGGIPHAGLDPRLRPLGLDERDERALLAFLESLTGSNVAELVEEMRREQPVAPPGRRGVQEPGVGRSRLAAR